MSAAWELDLPMTEKMVLLCLCDHANDDGDCWPSVERMAAKCSTTDRTIQRSLNKLRERGLLIVEVGGGRKNCNRYSIKTPTQCHPDTASPLPKNPDNGDRNPDIRAINPDTVSPEPSRTIKEPSKDNKAAKPFDVSAEVWADFQHLRKAKKAPLTPTALKAIEREAAKAGWSLQEALSECAARGWVGFKAEWIKEKINENRSARDGRDGVAKALDRRLGLGQSAGEAERYSLGGSREDCSGPIARLADLR
jgi:hypothetical protein